MENLKALIRDVPDFPKPGILFRDITPVLARPDAFKQVVDAMCALARLHGPTRIIGIESRGFLFGTPMATEMDLPFAPVRKPGKLPFKTVSQSYELEYGTDTLEIHADGVERGDRVIIVDDLLATGGTAEAACKLCESQGAEVAAVLVMIELTALKGVERLGHRQVYSLLKY